MYDIKSLIWEEWKDDDYNAQISFAQDDKKFEKVTPEQFQIALEMLMMDLVYDEVEADEYCSNHRFFNIYTKVLEIMARENEWEIINSFVYISVTIKETE